MTMWKEIARCDVLGFDEVAAVNPGTPVARVAPERLGLTVSSLPKHSGKLRVTVEEEVSECCEKWRGRLTYNYEPGAPGAMITNDPPTFCPECGRELARL